VLTVSILSPRLLTASLATLLGSLVLTLTAPAQTRQPAPVQVSPSANVAHFGMAVVDINYIFKNHYRFQAKMKGMKGDVEAAENVLKQEQQKIGKMQELLQTRKPGTPDYKQLDEQVAKAKAEFNLQASQQRKDFLDREAQIYYDTYLEVSQAVRDFAQRHKIGLVVRFNGDETDPNQPAQREDVLRLLNRPVVFQNSIDITPNVLADLNRDAPQVTGQSRDVPQVGRRPNVQIPRRQSR
jgi:Skp family chaperone for outer membrane proteins